MNKVKREVKESKVSTLLLANVNSHSVDVPMWVCLHWKCIIHPSCIYPGKLQSSVKSLRMELQTVHDMQKNIIRTQRELLNRMEVVEGQRAPQDKSVYDSDSYYEGCSLSLPRTHHTAATSTDTHAQSSSHRVSGNRPPTVQTNLHSAPICPKVTKRRSQVLDSAAIRTHQLISPDDVTAANRKIAKPSKAGPFSVKLAREAFFGGWCTCQVHGIWLQRLSWPTTSWITGLEAVHFFAFPCVLEQH
jgi:hypothetical protein